MGFPSPKLGGRAGGWTWFSLLQLLVYWTHKPFLLQLPWRPAITLCVVKAKSEHRVQNLCTLEISPTRGGGEKKKKEIHKEKKLLGEQEWQLNEVQQVCPVPLSPARSILVLTQECGFGQEEPVTAVGH